MERLLKRRDFLNAQKGRRASTGLFSMQAIQREDSDTPRCGFTVSKRVSPKAVVRNRIRRRLKEAVRVADACIAEKATDYVVVARISCLHAPFRQIEADLSRAFAKVALSQTSTLKTCTPIFARP